mgnify:FL=1
MTAEYPECEKALAFREKSQVCGEFLEWLHSKGYYLCYLPRGHELWVPIRENIEKLLAEFFGVDLNKVEQENRTMLEQIRKVYQANLPKGVEYKIEGRSTPAK